MKKSSLVYLVVFLFIVFLFSCDKKENEGLNNIYQSWEVTDFMSLESVAYPKDNSYNPVIEFKNDGSYSLKLDKNSCSGSFTLTEENNISISAAGCTKICCDSKFSQKFLEVLPQVTDYSIDENKLKLNIVGWGWINLVLNN
jgi:heat shock protein HslJ